MPAAKFALTTGVVYVRDGGTFTGPLTVTTGPFTLSNGQFLGPNGTVGAPTFSFTGEPDTGLYLSAANTWGLSGGGALGLDGNTSRVRSTLSLQLLAGLSSISPSAPIGYGAGSGGVVTQETSKATGVTINTVNGQITTHNATLNNATVVSFVVTNSSVLLADAVYPWIVSGATVGAYHIWTTAVADGSFTISIRNVSGGNLGQAIVIGYNILRGVIA